MSDLVERLRAGFQCAESGNRCRTMDAQSGCVCAEAADRIAQLEAEVKTWQGHARTAIWSDSEECKFLTARIEQLEAALEPLCCTCDRAASDECSRAEVNCAFWNARAALGERT